MYQIYPLYECSEDLLSFSVSSSISFFFSYQRLGIGLHYHNSRRIVAGKVLVEMICYDLLSVFAFEEFSGSKHDF